MRIVLAVHHFPPRYLGGAEWRAYRTAKALQAHGHSVNVICVEYIDRGPAQGVEWRDDVYDQVPVRRLSFNLSAAPDPFRWEYDNIWIGEHLAGFLREQRADVFHLICGYLMTGRAISTAKALGLPTVVSLTDFWFFCRRITMLRSDGRLSHFPINPVDCARCLGEERRRYVWLGRWLPKLMDWYWRRRTDAANRLRDRQTFLLHSLAQADALISPSQFLRDAFVQYGVRPGQITYMRQGREVEALTPEVIAKTPAPELRVGYLGQISEHKGLHILFEAVRRLPGVALTVTALGDPNIFPRYAARLRSLMESEPRLRLAGPFDGHAALTDIMRGLDVIVVPSLWYENSPNTILEAFAYRTPVVASNLGGMAELVQDGVNGLLFKLGDADDLAGCLRRLITEPGLLERLRLGIAPIKSQNEEIAELEALYARLVL